MKPLVIYHDNCADGFGAAFAAWLKLGNDAQYVSVAYDDELHRGGILLHVKDRDVYVLDFSFSMHIMQAIFNTAARVVWRDHHKTAFEDYIGGVFEGTEAHRQKDEVRDILLDFNKSGAVLAWQYFHPGEPVPAVIRHIDDRDRWQFKLPGTKEFSAALFSIQPWSFEQWREELLPMNPEGEPEMLLPECFMLYSTFLDEGRAILRAHEQNVAAVVKVAARKCMIGQTTVAGEDGWNSWPIGLAANCPPHLTSDVGHALAIQSGTFGLLWYVDKDSRCRCNLRSNGDYDVSAIARAFGGGGHRSAAGFEVPIETLLGWIK